MFELKWFNEFILLKLYVQYNETKGKDRINVETNIVQMNLLLYSSVCVSV